MGRCVMKFLKNAIIGICAGFITGFFSTGGGMIVLPALIYFMKMDEKMARATTVFAILPMVVVATVFYYRDRCFDFGLGAKCAVGGVFGSFVGTRLLKKVSNKVLKVVFIVFLVYAGVVMIIR